MRAASLCLLVFALGCSTKKTSNPEPEPGSTGGSGISGPYEHQNLAFYIVEDPKAKDAREFITLSEGLKEGWVTVTEKKSASVQELMIENKSQHPLFVQAGTVVKGGQQDRTIAADFVVPPNSGKSGIPSFCVEQGRWSSGKRFSAGNCGLSSNDLKIAVQKEKSQGKVWKEVSRHKRKMVDNNGLKGSTTDSFNEESGRKKIVVKMRDFEKALGNVLAKHPNACGVIVVINGKIQGSDIYGSTSLFKKLYPDLLRTAAIEAVANPAKEKKTTPTVAAVKEFLTNAKKGKTQEKQVRDRLTAKSTENAKTIMFACEWDGVYLHRQSLMK